MWVQLQEHQAAVYSKQRNLHVIKKKMWNLKKGPSIEN